MNLDSYIKDISQKISQQHPEFSLEEVQELCISYISRFNRKTKEVSKIKSLQKFLDKEFSLTKGVDTLVSTSKEANTIKKLSSLPKNLFQSQKPLQSDYILRIS
ncbi:MAG: hypothetical protein GXP45_04020 [bacterium]|nr:hypothetical protein [bacterium]